MLKSWNLGCVWFIPRVALPHIWLAKFLIDMMISCLPMNWPTFAKKFELELAVGHWHTKNLAIIQTHNNYLIIANKLVRYSLVIIQSHP
jgi:hypothetical protein